MLLQDFGSLLDEMDYLSVYLPNAKTACDSFHKACLRHTKNTCVQLLLDLEHGLCWMSFPQPNDKFTVLESL